MTTDDTAAEILISEAARLLNVCANHVRYLERTGQLRARRVGHIRIFLRKDVERLAAERYHRATGQAKWRGILDG